MNWTDIQAAIKAWLTAVTGLPVVWENEPRPSLLRTAFAILGTPTDITAMGQDWVQLAEIPFATELSATVVGQRIFTVPVRVISRNHNPATVARHYTERARLSLKMPSVLTTLQAAGLAVVTAGPTRQFDAKWDDRFESVASFELTLAAAAQLADIGDDLGTIGVIELSSDIDDAPSPPNYTNLEINLDP